MPFIKPEATAEEALEAMRISPNEGVAANVAESLFAIARALTRIAKLLEENSGITEEN